MQTVATPRYAATMPNARGTQPRQMRIDDETWADFGEAAKLLGTDRASLVREFIQWVLRRPGVKTPPRLTPEQSLDVVLARVVEHSPAPESEA